MPIIRHSTPVLAGLFLLLAAWRPAAGQTGANVLLVVNDRSAESATIAEHFARVRSVPADHLLRISVEPADEVERPVFDRQIQAPIEQWLTRHSAHDRILFIVLTKGVPLRVRGTSGRNGTLASVDSELALVYRKLAAGVVPVVGPVANPYYLGERPVAEAKAFTHASNDCYLVTRLDGFTVADVLALIDRAAAATQAGRVLLDQKPALDESGPNVWLQQAAAWLTANGFGERVELDTTSRVLTDRRDVLGYYSWGSNDPAITARRFNLQFVPGALAGMYVSTDGRTFKEPPADWTVGAWADRGKFFAGSPQSLAGDLIREGVTGIAAQVAEPYLDAAIRPQVLFPAYFSGFSLAEAFYLSMPYLSWQTVIVGDPLCAPFREKTLPQDEIDPGLDPSTELPRLFSARSLEALARQGVKPDAAAAVLRAGARTARGDLAGARSALETATLLAPRYRPAQLMLTAAYEQAGEHDKAIERYRRLLDADPKDWTAANNLAYALAVRKRRPAEALPFAERAAALAPNSAEVVDTLGWVQHLLGRDAEAAKSLARAVSLGPNNGEVRLHAAVVHVANGMLAAARTELAEALRLDPGLEPREEVKAVRDALK